MPTLFGCTLVPFRLFIRVIFAIIIAINKQVADYTRSKPIAYSGSVYFFIDIKIYYRVLVMPKCTVRFAYVDDDL